MPIPVLTVAQMREWEKATWASGRTETEVIERVGRIVGQYALQMTRPSDLILVLAGKGHNGDDARHAIPHLLDRQVVAINVNDPAAARQELLLKFESEPALIIDGLFGIGLNRFLEGDWAELVKAVNQSGTPVLSVDVPSGLNSDTGEVMGVAVHATLTLTLGAPKLGLLASTAWPYVGRLESASDIGLTHCLQPSDVWWTQAEDFENYPPRRPASGHKGTFGHVAIIAGSLGYHGAAVLCARAALRAQPGLVTVLTPENVYVPIASQLQAAMVSPWKRKTSLTTEVTAVVAGPGLASPDVPDELREEVIRSWQTLPVPFVADASALDWLPRGINVSGRLRVITPHPGEAARMLVSTADDVQRYRFESVRELSRRFGDCLVVLKGHQTCVGQSIGEIFVNSTGNPFLAQGGSGDVLAGYLGGLLAQPALARDPLTALRYGVWQHGAAADRLTREHPNWGVEDLVEDLGATA